MRPQVSPHSPLSSGRNIIAAWKSRSPSIDKSSQVSPADMMAERAYGARPRGVSGERELQWMVLARLFRRNRLLDHQVRSTPRTSTSLTPSGMVPPPFDLTELGIFAEEVIATFVHCRAFVRLCLSCTNHRFLQPLRIGLLW